MMKEILKETESLCPVCLSRVRARIITENNEVYLEKGCLQHGNYKVIIWRNDVNHYLKWAKFAGERIPIGPRKRLAERNRGCPYDCGLCPEHKQDTSMAVIMTTNKCNLYCPICFTLGGEMPLYEPSLDSIKRMYELVLDTCGAYPIELCGGEPTIRDDLPEIIAIGREMGFDYLQINTNGIRIAKDKEYLVRLKEAGATTIYLGFDGVTNDVYRYTAGRDLLELKSQAVSNCSEVKIGVILVPRIIPNLNFQQIGDIIQFAKKWVPTVKGILFQPVSYLGRYSNTPRDEDRVTIPDVLRGIEEQTQGELKATNFGPPVCEDPHCSFSGCAVLLENGKLLPTTFFNPRQINEDGAAHSREFAKKYWRFIDESEVRSCPLCQYTWTPFCSFLERLQREYLTIAGMIFQDVWNIDLERLKKCSIHIVSPTGKMVPLCAKYTTSVNGQNLYPGIA